MTWRALRPAVLLLAVACASAPPPPAPAPEALPVTRAEADLVAAAREAMGQPYRYGGQGSGGFDCSGLIQSVYARFGIVLPRVSRDQARAGRSVPRDVAALRPGDILAFANGGDAVTHVGLYVGDGRFIHSARTGVRESVLSEGDPDGRWYVRRWVGARRVLPESAAAP